MFDWFTEFLGRNPSKQREEQRKRIMDFAKKSREHYEKMAEELNRNRPRYEAFYGYTPEDQPPRKTGKYGPIYGSNISDWVQTKTEPPGKRFRPEKGKWKNQFDFFNFIVQDLTGITGQDAIRITVPNLFSETISRQELANRGMLIGHFFILGLERTKLYNLLVFCIEQKLIPESMEELV